MFKKLSNIRGWLFHWKRFYLTMCLEKYTFTLFNISILKTDNTMGDIDLLSIIVCGIIFNFGLNKVNDTFIYTYKWKS
jgi:hypothetical protein